MLPNELWSVLRRSVASQSVRPCLNGALSAGPSQPRRTFATVKDDQIDDQPPTTGRQLTEYKSLIARELYKALTVTPFNYTTPSPVQAAVFDQLPGIANPLTEQGENAPRDLLVKAKTGTGKTIAFLLPALQARIKDLERGRDDHPDPPKDVRNGLRYKEKATCGALILSPTRELAMQIANEASRLAAHINGAKVQLFIGGASKGMQLKSFEHLRRDIVVATPGRMIDMLNTSSEVRDVIATTRTLILDEADTLLDMGFKDDLERILEFMPDKANRQTFLFSATVPAEIQQIARKAMKPNHLFIDTVPPEEANVHLNIPQYATVLSEAKDQIPHIVRLLAHDMLLHPNGGKAIVFLPTTRLTELFAQVVDSMKKYMPWGARRTIVYELHSKKTQGSRDAAADRFRKASGGYHILVTSDVSARGVDYPNVTRVIQVGVPSSRDIYIHRVGRTGRAGKAGRGDIVLLPWEQNFLRALDDLPVKRIDSADFVNEVQELAEEQDAAPSLPASQTIERRPSVKSTAREIFSLRRNSSPGMVVSGPMQSDIANRIGEIDAGVQEDLFQSLDSYMVKEAFGSLLGYYMPRGSELRIPKMDMVKGLKQWAQESMGLSEEPYVSESMLQKMGVSRERRSSGRSFSRDSGFSRDSRDSRGSRDSRETRTFRSSDSAPWSGRGRQGGREQTSRFQSDRPDRGGDKERGRKGERWMSDRKPPRLNSYHDKDDRRPFNPSFGSSERREGGPRDRFERS